MTLLKEKVQTILEKQIGEVRKAGLAATAQVRTQVTNRAITILEAKAVDAETVHPNTVRAAVKKGINMTVKHAQEVVNKDVVYLVKKGATVNMGLVFGLEMAGNIDKLAYETIIALALSNGATDEYPASVSKLKGMAAIEDNLIETLQKMATEKEYKLTIGAYIVEFTVKELEALMGAVRSICKKARNGAEKAMAQYLADKEAEQTAPETTPTVEEQPVTTDTVEEATTEPTRYERNVAAVKQFIEKMNVEPQIAKSIFDTVIADNDDKLQNFPLTNKITDSISPLVKAAVDKLFPPAVDETSAAVENKENKEEKEVKETTTTVFTADINGEETALVTLDEYTKDVNRLKAFAADVEKSYQEHITGIMETHQAVVSQYDAKIAELEKKVAELAAQNAEITKDLNKQTTLRKADNKKIEKLEKEVGRVKVVLKEHKVREISKDSVIQLAEDVEVGAVIGARIKTAGAIEKAAQSIHENAPAKIEKVADVTKDGIQWTADRAKDVVDVTAKVTNWSSEKVGNTMTLVADKVAPTTVEVAESAAKYKPANDEKPYLIINGRNFYKQADGTLKLG